MPLSGLYTTKRRPTSIRNCFRGFARGTPLTITVSLSLSAGPVPWSHGHATYCLLLLLTIIVIRSIPQLIPSPPRGAGCYAGPQACVVRVTYMSKHWSKPATQSPGVPSAVATVKVLRFSAMIIGPSRAEHH